MRRLLSQTCFSKLQLKKRFVIHLLFLEAHTSNRNIRIILIRSLPKQRNASTVRYRTMREVEFAIQLLYLEPQRTWNSEFETIHLYCTSDYDRSSTMINGNVILSDNDLQRIRYTFLLSRPSMNSPARDLEDEDESNRPSIDDISPKEEQAKSNQAFTGIPQ